MTIPNTPDVAANRAEWEKLTDTLREVQEKMAAATDPAAVVKLGVQATSLRDAIAGCNKEWDSLKKAFEAPPSGLEKFKAAFADAAKSAAVGGIVGERLGGMFGQIGGSFGRSIGTVAGALHGVGEAEGLAAKTGASGAAVAAIAGAVREFLQQSISLVKLSDPGRVERLNQAMEDLHASIGASLVPVIDVATKIFDRANQVFTSLQATLRPAFEKLMSAVERISTVFLAVLQPALQLVADYWSSLADALQATWAQIEKPINDLAAAMIQLMEAMRPLMLSVLPVLTHGLAYLASITAQAITMILRAVGIDAAGGLVAPRGPQTTAARSPQYIELEEIGRQARLAAFGSRSVGEQQVEQLQLNNQRLGDLSGPFQALQKAIDDLAKTATDWLKQLGEWWDQIARLAGQVADALTAIAGLPQKIAEAIRSAIPSPFGGGGGAGGVGGLVGPVPIQARPILRSLFPGPGLAAGALGF